MTREQKIKLLILHGCLPGIYVMQGVRIPDVVIPGVVRPLEYREGTWASIVEWRLDDALANATRV